ncbi:MAG: 50S ribosomal protein L24e [Candidatus Micrarchaeota archaeon]|nr:50S ribosomal protein L24e [Candidatus Micrarchaeota archaeon]
MKCSYCTAEIEKGTGLMYVKRAGAIRYYCSNRCYKFNEIHKRRINKKELKERSSR